MQKQISFLIQREYSNDLPSLFKCISKVITGETDEMGFTLSGKTVIINLLFLQSNQIFSTCSFIFVAFICVFRNVLVSLFFSYVDACCTLRLAARAEEVKVRGRFVIASADSSLLWRWLLWNCRLCFRSLSGYLFFSKLGGPVLHVLGSWLCSPTRITITKSILQRGNTCRCMFQACPGAVIPAWDTHTHTRTDLCL